MYMETLELVSHSGWVNSAILTNTSKYDFLRAKKVHFCSKLHICLRWAEGSAPLQAHIRPQVDRAATTWMLTVLAALGKSVLVELIGN